MSQEKIDLLPLLNGRDDGSGELLVNPGDLIKLVAETGELWLPAIFAPDSFEHLQGWVEEVRVKLRASGVHTTVISADVFDRDDDHRQLEVELQVTFVGSLPVQLDAMGDFYGYDEDGNLLTREQYFAFNYERDVQLAGAVAWSVIGLAVGALLVTTYAITTFDAWVSSPESRESIEEVSDAAKTISVAAAIVALVFLLRKA